MKAVQAWRDAHGGALPEKSPERAEFKDLLRSRQRSIDGCPIPEENFAEAVASAHKVWAPRKIREFFSPSPPPLLLLLGRHSLKVHSS